MKKIASKLFLISSLAISIFLPLQMYIFHFQLHLQPLIPLNTPSTTNNHLILHLYLNLNHIPLLFTNLPILLPTSTTLHHHFLLTNLIHKLEPLYNVIANLLPTLLSLKNNIHCHKPLDKDNHLLLLHKTTNNTPTIPLIHLLLVIFHYYFVLALVAVILIIQILSSAAFDLYQACQLNSGKIFGFINLTPRKRWILSQTLHECVFPIPYSPLQLNTTPNPTQSLSTNISTPSNTNTHPAPTHSLGCCSAAVQPAWMTQPHSTSNPSNNNPSQTSSSTFTSTNNHIIKEESTTLCLKVHTQQIMFKGGKPQH